LLYRFDIRHMPQGCATWPAAWTVIEDGWPAGGEIDIIEGVNDESPNHSTLHTSPGSIHVQLSLYPLKNSRLHYAPR
jgi:beta-glucanase (GH16 family)